MELLGWAFLLLILIFGVPIGISYLIFRWIKKRNLHPNYRLFASIPLLILSYFLYTAFYPDVNFYKEVYQEVTHLPFPANGKIIYKSASYPDQHGDYCASFVAELDELSYKQLESTVQKMGFLKDAERATSSELEYVEWQKGKVKYSAEYIKDEGLQCFMVGFINDNKTVIISRMSS